LVAALRLDLPRSKAAARSVRIFCGISVDDLRQYHADELVQVHSALHHDQSAMSAAEARCVAQQQRQQTAAAATNSSSGNKQQQRQQTSFNTSVSLTTSIICSSVSTSPY
jgi:hypothetical protein